jgi:hypothetical protein
MFETITNMVFCLAYGRIGKNKNSNKLVKKNYTTCLNYFTGFDERLLFSYLKQKKYPQAWKRKIFNDSAGVDISLPSSHLENDTFPKAIFLIPTFPPFSYVHLIFLLSIFLLYFLFHSSLSHQPMFYLLLFHTIPN